MTPMNDRHQLTVTFAVALIAVVSTPVATSARADTLHTESVSTPAPTPTSARVTTTGKIEHWASPTLLVSIDDSVDDLAPGARVAIETALSAWPTNDGKMPTLSFATTHAVNVGSAPDGVNSIVAAPITIAGHERDLAVTVSYARDDTGEIVEADIIINTTWTWGVLAADGSLPTTLPTTWPNTSSTKTLETAAVHDACLSPAPDASVCGDRFDVEAILTHESGHFFGLGENLLTPTSTMFYCSNPCEVHKRAPLDLDRASLARIYVDVLPSAPKAASCDVRRDGAATRAPLMGTALSVCLGLAAIARLRRRARRTRTPAIIS
ncbi:MAG: hypothetical protein ACHREM_21095 [Polyangiales bacterium]